jgi:VCBS repeat-containing protein
LISSIKRPVALLSVLLLTMFVIAPVLAVAPAPGPFERTWARTDKPVADGVLARTWIWGPQANTGVMQEPYLQSPGGERDVQYFDKSRMEINNPNAVDDGLWFVTNGLLVVELMSGMMQVGDFQFEERSPADINIVGDPGYAETPTYADYADLRDNPAFAAGTVIVATIDGDGNIGTNNDLAQWNVTASELAPLTGHRTASVFWEFMNSSGIVYENGEFVNDDLFLNPYYATGYPITEAYWSRVMLAGSEQWVLTQAFERRVLTYAPNNNPGFQVEAGNVGLHYYQWRYETPETGALNVTTFEFDGTTAQGSVLVEAYLLDNGETCDDVAFGTDSPTASGTTNAATGALSLSDLDAGMYCVGADFDGDGIANDDTALVALAAGASVAVSLVNPDDGTTNTLTVTVIGDDDIVVAGATVNLYAGTCDDLVGGATPVASAVTAGAGIVILNVDDLDDGDYCLVASNVSGIIGEADVTLPDDTEATIGGMIGVVVTTPVGVNEVQVLEASGATSGTFTLTFAGETTAPIMYNASAAAIQVALENLSNVGVGDVQVTGGPINTTDVTVTFMGGLGLQNVPTIVADTSNLNDAELSISTTTIAEPGVNEVQTLTPTGVTAGTFTLTFNGQTTAPIDWDASAADIGAALNLLSTIDGDVVAGGGPIDSAAVSIEFVGDLAATNVNPISVNNTNLTGTIAATTTTQGFAGVNEVQTIDATGAVSGTFTLTFDGETTNALPFNAGAAQIQAALEGLANIGAGDVAVAGGPVNTTAVTITFTGNYAATNVALITGDDSLLLGSQIVVTTTTQGASPVTQVVYVGSAVTGGTFTLTYEGQTTAPVAHNATAAQLEAALEALSNIDNVAVTGNLGAGASSTITFVDPSPPASLLVVDDTLIT